MEFSWTPEQRALEQRMHEVGRAVGALPAEDRVAALAAEGVLGLSIDREFGGGGCDLLTTALAYEGLGATLDDAGALLVAGAHLFGVAMTLSRVGNTAQRERLRDLASGRVVATIAATEERAGSDIAACESVAAPDRAHGDKRFVTWADRAGLYFFVGRQPEGRGLTALLVPRDAPGVVPGVIYDHDALRGARLGPVSFQEVALPDGCVIGKPGAGMAVFQLAMSFERAMILAFRLGAMERALDDAVSHARARRIGKHQAVSHRIARMKLRLETARLLVYRAAWALDQDARAHAEAALAKWHVAEAALDNALDAMRLQGGGGVTDPRFAAQVSESMAGTVHSGTSDVLANVVASWLGL